MKNTYTTTTLTNDQKARLAGWLISTAAEFLSSGLTDDPDLHDIDREAAAKQLAVWLDRLPGTMWHMGLPNPRATSVT